MTYSEFNKYCSVCMKANLNRKPNYRRKQFEIIKPKKFGEVITSDHFFGKDKKHQDVIGEGDGLVIYDLATDFGYCYPVKDGTSKSAKDGFVHFKGKDKFDYVYTDKSPTLIKAVKEIGKRAIPHETSVPGVPATNGIAEAMVKRTIRGIRANLAQAGLPRAYWRKAAEHHWMARNIQDQESDGKSPWERRHRHVFDGLQLPF